MTIQLGQKIPDATLTESVEFGEACPLAPADVSVAQATRGKRIVLFSLPGAYTPTCSGKQLPGYLKALGEFKARKIDEVWCVSVNDGYVMAAWGREQGAIGKIRMLGDGNGELAKKLGLENDHTKGGMGTRLRRCSMLLDDGVVKLLNLDAPGKFEVSDAATILKQLS